MLRSKHLAGLILVATLMATLIPSLASVYAEGEDKQREKAEAFVAVAEEAKNEVDALMSTIGEEGVPPELKTLYDEGVGNLTAAQDELGKEDPDYDLAISLAKEAMRIFRKVYEQLNTLLEGEEAGEETGEETGDEEEGPDVETEEGEEPEDPNTLMEAIERARRRIDRVEDIIDANDAYLTDYAEDELNDLLERAGALLGEAEGALGNEPPEVSTAAHKLGDAHKLISQAFVALKKAAGALNTGRINGFLTVISKFYDRVARWAEREGLDYSEELEDIWSLIDGVHTQDQETQFADIVANLMEARIRLESIQNEIRGKSE